MLELAQSGFFFFKFLLFVYFFFLRSWTTPTNTYTHTTCSLWEAAASDPAPNAIAYRQCNLQETKGQWKCVFCSLNADFSRCSLSVCADYGVAKWRDSSLSMTFRCSTCSLSYTSVSSWNAVALASLGRFQGIEGPCIRCCSVLGESGWEH